ncbi:putative O-methyltransferase [Xylariaceae sp. AK1471]|nr:putative O-methyltransferase [Xylariaceae sp. AK1471]
MDIRIRPTSQAKQATTRPDERLIAATMTSVETLAATISEQVLKLSTLLADAGSPAPTLEESGFDDFSHETDTPAGVALRETRSAILDAAQDLLRLVRGPTDQILGLAWSVADTANLDLITRLKIPQSVPLRSSISIDELAKAIQVPEALIARIVRYAIANGVFVEEKPGYIGHSASSAALVWNPHLSKIIHFSTDFLGNVLLKVPEAVVAKRDDPEHAPDAAFNIAYCTNESLFSLLQESGDLNTKYHEYLAGRASTPLWSVDRLRAAWPWSSMRDATVIDVGGSSGHTVQYLASLMPVAKFIIQDNNKSALDMGRRAVEASAADPSLSSRISFQEYDFFTPQPVEADIYIYRHILHDWNDEDAVKILSSLLPALKPGSRVLISEGIVPAPPAQRLNTLARKMIRIEDMFMLAVHDAHERSVPDFESLFEKVSPRAFRLVGVTSGTEAGAFQSLLEFEYLGPED